MLSGREWSATPKILAMLTKTGERGRAEEREGLGEARMRLLPQSHFYEAKGLKPVLPHPTALSGKISTDWLRQRWVSEILYGVVSWEATKPWLLLPSLLFSRLRFWGFFLTKQNHLKWSLILFCHNSLFLFQKLKIKFYCVTWKGRGDRQMWGEEVSE